MKKRKKKLIWLILSVIVIVCATATVYFGTGSDAPAVKSIKNTQDGIEITWEKCKNAKSYNLYRDSGNGQVQIQKLSDDECTFLDKNVKSSVTYKYYVSAKFLIGESEQCAAVIKYLKMPAFTEVRNYTTGINLKWSASKGAEKYAVYRKTKDSSFKVLTYITKCSYKDTDVQPSTRYFYRVRAISGTSKSKLSVHTSCVFLKAPKITSVKNTAEGVEVKWKTVDLADSYAVFRKNADKNGKWVRAGVVNGKSNNSFVDKKAPQGDKCIYKIRVYYKQFASGFIKQEKENVYLKNPVLSNITYSKGKTVISWNKSDNITGYYVYRKIGYGKFKLTKTLTAAKTSYSEKKPKKNVKIEYAVQSYKGDYKSVMVQTGLVRYVDVKKPMVALTFDDGPGGSVTQTILDVLAKYDARATFFVVGNRVNWESSEKVMKRAVSMGCEIGNHTYEHTYSSSELLDGLNKTSKAVKEVIGEDTQIMRPPGGSYGETYKSICPYPMIMWSVDTRDWESRNADSVISMVKRFTYDGAIILMHDLYPSTAEAVKSVVPWLKKQGYQLVTVSEMMEARGVKMTAGNVYFDAKK